MINIEILIVNFLTFLMKKMIYMKSIPMILVVSINIKKFHKILFIIIIYLKSYGEIIFGILFIKID